MKFKDVLNEGLLLFDDCNQQPNRKIKKAINEQNFTVKVKNASDAAYELSMIDVIAKEKGKDKISVSITRKNANDFMEWAEDDNSSYDAKDKNNPNVIDSIYDMMYK